MSDAACASDVLSDELERQASELNDKTLQHTIDLRVIELMDYQNIEYADRYIRCINKVRYRDIDVGVSPDLVFTQSVARNLFKLMVYKDEYEVAREYNSNDLYLKRNVTFAARAQIDPSIPHPASSHNCESRQLEVKRRGWLSITMRMLAAFKFLRGTRFDPFGYAKERRMDRELVERYISIIDAGLMALSADTYQHWINVASVPEIIRGYGNEKHDSMAAAEAKWHVLLDG